MHDDDAGAWRLRPFIEADCPRLAALWVEAWRRTMPNLDFEARRGWILDFLSNAHAQTWTTIVALDATGDPAGFVTVEPGRSYLHQLAVSPMVKGQGVAVVLLDAAKASAPSGLTLDVNQANTRALRFYEREGFVRVGAGVNETSGLSTWALGWRP